MLVVDVDANTGNWELSLKVFQDDLELAITGHVSGSDLTSAVSDTKIQAYLRENLQLLADNTDKVKWRWVGSETEGDALWIYMEVPKGKAGVIKAIKAGYLQHLFADQVNMINMMNGAKVVTLASHKGNSVVTVN